MYLNDENIFDENLSITNINRVYSIRRLNGENFYYPFTAAAKPKVYIVRNDENEVLYVGYAESSISTRLRSGLNNVYPYRWRDEGQIRLTVFLSKSIEEGGDLSFEELQAVTKGLEAEIALYVKNNKGYWPKYQQEIHFTNLNQELIEEATEFIISHIEIA